MRGDARGWAGVLGPRAGCSGRITLRKGEGGSGEAQRSNHFFVPHRGFFSEIQGSRPSLGAGSPSFGGPSMPLRAVGGLSSTR